jgi:hypothetical protein
VTTANRKGNGPKKKGLPSAFTQSKSAKQKRRLKMEMEAYSTELGFTEEVLILNVFLMYDNGTANAAFHD